MNRSEVSEKDIASTIAVLCIILLLIIMTWFLFPNSVSSLTNDLKDFLGLDTGDENPDNIFTPDIASFTSPSIPSYSVTEKELTPILRTPLQPGFSISSNYQTSELFQGGVGYLKIRIKNEGRNPIFIDRYGVSVNSTGNRIFSEDCGVLLTPGEEQVLGIITVQVPEKETARFSIVLWLLASTSEGKWHEYDPYVLNGFAADLKPMPEKMNPKYRYNPDYYFKTINRLVEPSEPSVRARAAETARLYPGAYNIYQVCALFDMVKEEVEYISDPRGNDIWEPANVTLRIGAGDCEDQAILLSSMIEAIGGTTRVYLTDDHAFAAVYLGNGTEATENAVKGVRTYYGDVDVNYLTDEYGSWLMLDPTSSLYAGGLPGKTAQIKIKGSEGNETERSWTFVNTRQVKVIDISTREIK
ncbi:transglutaminase family protein [Methanosarcina hadiensis]|uniref:transglutaminase-like domain-containing protein n=1 Tax=Methanosarcina hadiensis TaxID=3078083 RepID=UPI00397769D3